MKHHFVVLLTNMSHLVMGIDAGELRCLQLAQESEEATG
jgi:hypothetical protein